MSKRDQTYQILLDRINSGAYPAQSYIDEKAIARELESSRTPVREAILALAQEGYLKILPQRGIIVLPFTFEDASDVFQIRKLLEPWLIQTYGPSFTREELEQERRCVETEDREIHKNAGGIPGISMMHHPHAALIGRCRNQFISNILQNVERQCLRIPNDRAKKTPYVSAYSHEEIIQMHLDLVDLMIRGDFDGAAAEMTRHVQIAESEYMRYWFNA